MGIDEYGRAKFSLLHKAGGLCPLTERDFALALHWGLPPGNGAGAEPAE